MAGAFEMLRYVVVNAVRDSVRWFSDRDNVRFGVLWAVPIVKAGFLGLMILGVLPPA